MSPSRTRLITVRFCRTNCGIFILRCAIGPLSRTPLGLRPVGSVSETVQVVHFHTRRLRILSSQVIIYKFSTKKRLYTDLYIRKTSVRSPSRGCRGFSGGPSTTILSCPMVAAKGCARGSSFMTLCKGDPAEGRLRCVSVRGRMAGRVPPYFV